MSRLICSILACVAMTGCMSPQQREFESKWTGRAAPDFKLKDLAGKDVQLAAYRGRPVVLTFFGYG